MNISWPKLFWKYLNTRRWWWGVLSAFLGFALAGGWYLMRSGREIVTRELPGETIRTEGKLQSREMKSEWTGRSDDAQFESVYLLRYKYLDTEGQPFTGTAIVTQVAFNSVTEGDSVQVEFSAARPDLSRLVGVERLPIGFNGFALLMGLGLICLGGFYLMATALGKAARRSRVIAFGHACLGRVNEVNAANERQYARLHRARYCLGYSFTDLKGMARDGRTLPLTRELASQWQPGDPILVLFHPQNIFRHEVDLYGARANDLSVLLERAGE